MSMGKKDRLMEVVDAAFEGRSLDSANAADAAKFVQFQKIAKTVGKRFFEPEEAVVGRAKAVFPTRVRKKLSLLLRRSSALQAGARLASGDEAQVAFEAGGVRLRILYTRSPEGWDIVGQASEGPWIVTVDQAETWTDDEGRFTLTVKGDSTKIALVSRESEIEIPAFEELAQLDPGLDS